MKILNINYNQNKKTANAKNLLPHKRTQLKNSNLNHLIPQSQINQLVFCGNIMTNEPSNGFNAIPAFENELDFVNFKLINPLIKNDNKENIPNGIIIFGPTGSGKTCLADVILDEFEKNKIKIYKPKIFLSQNMTLDGIKNVFETAKLKYQQTGEYSAIKIPIDI